MERTKNYQPQLEFTPGEAAARESASQQSAEAQEGIRLCYEHSHGKLYQGDSSAWLRTLDDNIADLVFADPPYNVNKAEWDDFESQEHYIKWSVDWIRQAARVLKPTGSLYSTSYRRGTGCASSKRIQFRAQNQR